MTKALFEIFGIRPTILIKEWCTCGRDDIYQWIAKGDGECKCGVTKHHYHCDKCGRITQVG